MSNKMFYITDHALKRMESRNISRVMLARIIFRGQIFSCGDGRFKAKYRERVGKSEICYEAIFSKQDNIVFTVWSNIRPCRYDIEGNEDKPYMKHKVYKRRKRMISEREFDAYCREEFSECNLRYCA